MISTGKTSVKKATFKAYQEMPKFFTGPELCRRVREKLRKKRPMDSTITRRLRELHEEEKINYSVIDTRNSKYEKVA